MLTPITDNIWEFIVTSTSLFSYAEMESILRSVCPVSGKTHSVNHDACRDKRGRLYVTNTDGKFLFFCHNCQTKGCYIPDAFNIRQKQQEAALTTSDPRTYLMRYKPHSSLTYDDYVYDYFAKYFYFSRDELNGYLFRYSGGKAFENGMASICFGSNPDVSNVDYMPLTETMFKFHGKQAWHFKSDGFINKMSIGNISPTVFYDVLSTEWSDLLVICEDPISAMCISALGADALCLFGCRDNLFALSDYVIGYDKVAVWLDCDSVTNVDLADKITRGIGLFCPDAYNVHALFNELTSDRENLRHYCEAKTLGYFKRDPKNYKPDVVEHIIISLREGK